MNDLVADFMAVLRAGRTRGIAKAREREETREQENWLTTKPVSTTTDQPLISTTDTRRIGEYRETAPCFPRDANELREQGRL